VQELIAVDLETTGFDPDADRIIEIGAVRVRLTLDGVEPGERFSTFVDPGRDVGPAITRLTGIQDRDLVGAPSAAEAVARFTTFAGAATFVGHNVDFDLAFLERNGLHFTASEAEAAQAVLELAAGSIDETGFAAFLRDHVKRTRKRP